MHKYLKHIGTLGLALVLLASTGAPSVSAKSWNWRQAFSIHRALKNSQTPNKISNEQRTQHRRSLTLYTQLRHNHYSPNASLAILTLVHTNNSDYGFNDVKLNHKHNNGYFGFDKILNTYYLKYAHIDNEDPNSLITQSNFVLSFYGLHNFKHSDKAVHKLVSQLSNVSEDNMHLLTKAENNNIHSVMSNLS